MRWGREYVMRVFGLLAMIWILSSIFAWRANAQAKYDPRVAESENMKLVGHDDLQGRAAYQPIVVKQGDRYIAYIGHHVDGEEGSISVALDVPEPFNSLTGKQEPNGTSVVDVTDPSHPKYLAHIPGPQRGYVQLLARAAQLGPNTEALSGGAQFVRACSGAELPQADKNKFYLLKPYGQTEWQIWDVTDPSDPKLLTVIANGFHDTHKPWWECDTGIAYLVAGPLDWRVPPAGTPNVAHDVNDHVLIYDLSDPAKPKFIRSFGLPEQAPGATGPLPLSGTHDILSTGPKGNRVYVTYGNNEEGIVQTVDRQKLLDGPKEPTPENLRYPVIGQINLPATVGAHSAIPLYHVQPPEYIGQKHDNIRDYLAVTGEDAGVGCTGLPLQMLHIFDVTDESRPLGVASWIPQETSGNFCDRGGRFGTNSIAENFTMPLYYNRVIFVTTFVAGVHAIDVRDPLNPKDIAYYIPGITDKTSQTCSGKPGPALRCANVIEMNNAEVDDRGYIYLTDRADTGLFIFELTGPERQMVCDQPGSDRFPVCSQP
jgi:hypothetical protein